MGMFGGAFKPRNGSIDGFTPPAPGIAGTAGLIGDILTHSNVTGQRLDADTAFAQAQYQSAHPAPMNVGGNLVQADGQGGYKTVYAAPAALDSFGQMLTAAGIDPKSPQGQAQYRLKINNEVDPIHAYPTTDAAGNQGLIFKRPSEMGAAGTPATQIKDAAGYAALPPGTPYIDPNGQHRVKGGGTTGGAAPATGPGGFSLYPAGHGRSGPR